MSNKVTYGLSNVHVAFLDSEGGYETPIKIPGAVSFTPTTAGGQSNFAADNDNNYFVHNVNNGYTADLSMALIPDSVLAKMLGWEVDDNGALLEVADGKPTKFALMFQVEGDQKNRKTVYYDVQANRPAKEHATTTDNIEVNPDQISVIISKKEIDGKLLVKSTLEENETNTTQFENFFDSVYGLTSESGA